LLDEVGVSFDAEFTVPSLPARPAVRVRKHHCRRRQEAGRLVVTGPDQPEKALSSTGLSAVLQADILGRVVPREQ